MKTYTGIVKWFNPEKGYGFITVSPAVKAEYNIAVADDLFFHANELPPEIFPRTIAAEQLVTFSVKPHPRGPRACRLQIKAPSAHGRDR